MALATTSPSYLCHSVRRSYHLHRSRTRQRRLSHIFRHLRCHPRRHRGRRQHQRRGAHILAVIRVAVSIHLLPAVISVDVDIHSQRAVTGVFVNGDLALFITVDDMEVVREGDVDGKANGSPDLERAWQVSCG